MNLYLFLKALVSTSPLWNLPYLSNQKNILPLLSQRHGHPPCLNYNESAPQTLHVWIIMSQHQGHPPCLNYNDCVCLSLRPAEGCVCVCVPDIQHGWARRCSRFQNCVLNEYWSEEPVQVLGRCRTAERRQDIQHTNQLECSAWILSCGWESREIGARLEKSRWIQILKSLEGQVNRNFLVYAQSSLTFANKGVAWYI